MAFFGLKKPQKGLRATYFFWEHPKMFSASDEKKSLMGPIEPWRLTSPTNTPIFDFGGYGQWSSSTDLISDRIPFLFFES